MKNPEEFVIAVIGMGAMGTGIAQHFAAAGHEVHGVVSQREGAEERARRQVEAGFQTLAEASTGTAERMPEALNRIRYFTDLEQAVRGVDLVIESIPEKRDLKIQMFEQLDRFCGDDVILCSNTSSLPVFDFLTVRSPQRLIITHFFVPAYAMPLVELVRGPHTSDETVAACRALMESSGKRTAVIRQCVPGFILNRLTFALFREAAYIVEQGWAEPADVDNAVTAIHGSRFSFEGPFALADMAGLETYRNICEYLLPELCASPEVPASLRKLADSGRLGVKSGDGYFHWEDPEVRRSHRERRILKNVQVNRELDREYPR